MLEKLLNYVRSAQVTSATITPLKVDGYAGKKTIKLLEGYFGCKKTGVLTGQKKTMIQKYAPNVTAVKYSGKKSLCVKKLQAWVGFPISYINGVWDNNLSYSLQIKLTELGFSTGKIDAVFGKESVKALQRFLNAQIPQPEPQPQPTPTPSTLGDKIMQACYEQAVWMKNAKYGKWKPVTIAHSKSYGTCVTYEGCVLQRLGYKKSGGYVYQNGSGKGTGKVTHANSRMTVTYMNNKKLSSLKNVIQKGDMLLFDDTTEGHVCFATGEWNGDNAYVWDVGKKMICERTSEPRLYDGSHKLLAIVRLK